MFKLFVISFFIGTIRAIELDQLDSDVAIQCTQQCNLQNSSSLDHYDYTCDRDCISEQCLRGCNIWKQALSSSCPKVCDGHTNRIKAKDLYCRIGCNNAISTYFTLLSARIGKPPPPALVADSLNSTSLKLEWNFPEGAKSGLTCYVQWRYVEKSESWQNCVNVSWNLRRNVAFIGDLKPYTKYRFRVALIPMHHGEPILSLASVVISTLPSGVPESSPIIVRYSAVDFTRISVRWEPGPFPHGPLLKYVLQISAKNPQVHTEVKELQPEERYYVFRNLVPSTSYNVSVRMRNSIGLGPPALVTVSTPAEPQKSGSKKPILILGTEHSVIEQGTYILDEPMVLYETEKGIRGLAVHIHKQLLFVSVSDGYVAKLSIENKTTSYILNPETINFKPLDLSVDWLNNQLYILGEVGNEHKMWQISRCNLDGSSLTVAIAGLVAKPHCMEVDPYNGYLFWVLSGSNKGGLYRLDLSDISNGIKHEVGPDIILKDPFLGAFTLDHTNFSLLVSRQKENTIYSVSLDGKEIYNMRPKVTKSKMDKVISIATANKMFYWTDGDNVYYEEHRDAYFHNSYPDLSARSYKKVIVNLESSQPIPIPVNPPRNLQAVFNKEMATIYWQPPHLLEGQGKGTWQNWSYEVSLKEPDNQITKTVQGINSTLCKVQNLTDNTKYIVKVAAYTSFGKGPWSREFIGSTLVNKSKTPYILWATGKGLYQTDPTGQNVKTLMHGNIMKQFLITDIAWFENQIYFVTNLSQMFWYDTETHKYGKHLDSVGAIAIDWIGEKLYWSNPKQQMIIRGNLNATQQEPLSISAVAKELEVDSVKAYIYWSTGYGVECAHFNGVDKMDYSQATFFSGKQVMGLTLDMDRKNVFWIIRSSEGSTLFRAEMAGYVDNKYIIPQSIASLDNPLLGPLCYFHNRLLWLQDGKQAVISDLSGRNIVYFRENTMTDITTVTVVDPTIHQLPESKTNKLIVIPDVINRHSIKVVGSTKSFNVSWDPVKNVNYGTVFYEVQIDPLSRNDSTIITTHPSIKYWQTVTPFTKLHVSIRAYTYWGASPELRAKIFSPSSTPSSPKNVRYYVIFQSNFTKNDLSTIVFRWDVPLFPNGNIRGYKVFCWYYENETKIDICQKVVKHSDEWEHIVKNLKRDRIYYFEVKGFTDIGDGKMSETLFVHANKELPLPTLLLANSDSIYIQDIDSNKKNTLIHGISSPVELDYLMQENKIFWINQMSELFMYSVIHQNKTKLYDIKGEALSISVDWLERSVYYLEKRDNVYLINKINLNIYENRLQIQPVEILKRSDSITKIEVSPFVKKLYWIEKKENLYYALMESDLNGTGVASFFSKYSRTKRFISDHNEEMCNCPLNPTLENLFTLDHSNERIRPLINIINYNTKNIVSMDENACFCDIVANLSMVEPFFPIDKIKTDIESIYWTNPQKNFVYMLKRKQGSMAISKEIKALSLSIYGHHTQPFPQKTCLIPSPIKNITKSSEFLIKKTSTMLKISIPKYTVTKNCSDTSLPTAKYIICYSEINYNCSNCLGDCSNITSFNNVIEIKKLKPFTKYKIQFAYSNYFTEKKPNVFGLEQLVETAPGAPSKPLLLAAKILNPTLAEITWESPRKLNGATVYYEIHWQTEGRSGKRKKEEQSVQDRQSVGETKKTFKALLHKLSPNETYTVWVRAYCETNETSTDSDAIKFVTYPLPDMINLLNRTSSYMMLSWNVSRQVKNVKVEYSAALPIDWLDVKHHDVRNNCIYFEVDSLSPKTIYKFRLLLSYDGYNDYFVWPQESGFPFETLGDKPSAPGVPIIQYISPNSYRVWWEASKDNGAPIEIYKLEGLLLRHYRYKRTTNVTTFFDAVPSIAEVEPEWKIFYNGTNTSWIIDGLSEDYKYVFRVSAKNSYGWSEPSKESIEFDLNETAKLADKQNAMTVVIIATGITICFIFILLIILTSLICNNKKKEPQIIHTTSRGPDVELATLRELPRRGIHNTNILYLSTLPSEEIKLLPHIKREQITLTKFLGSGAFGEVFEGKAKDIGSLKGHTRVAVKTLRKGALDQEKSEFLQEAQLMSHFKHEHILELLGVCLDNDPHFIIMELMEGGDLLTYLRSSRNLSANIPSLSLMELLKMCVDVSKGCRYLEEMHFVHRDLACRNCLVSSTNSNSRIVKIGDFGLARDIYKNDYYRKEGEGLLPVRWMAPESLMDGVFTTQSDVWAFGVLLWEIMTLGQQPYPARNNIEVLQYVKGGGRLGKPIDCPVDLHALMLKCWKYVPENRPTFKYCLEILLELYEKYLRTRTTGAHENYISTVPEGPLRTSENRDDQEKVPFLFDTTNNLIEIDAPKYLELVADVSHCIENDGYEIPNQMLQSLE